MKRILSVLAVLVTLTLLCGVLAPLAAAIDTTGFAAQVVTLVNEKRAENNKRALSGGNTTLHAAAQQRAEEYAANPALEHTRPGNKHFSTVFAEFDITWTACGENIAEGFTTPAAVVAGWMGSESHKKNILGQVYNYTHIGVGVCEGTDGKLYWAQLFINDGSASTSPSAGDLPGGGGNNESFFTRIINWFRNLWDSFINLFRF